MNIVTGRGKSRSVFTFPCAHFVHNSKKPEQKQALGLLCGMLNIPTDDKEMAA